MEASDHDLLQQFAAQRSEDAFRQLVDRHVGMVFGVADRVTGDAQLAEEIAQTTFTTLARKACTLDHQEALAGWLYHTARHLALRAIRAEQRRRQREQIAAAMNINEPGPNLVAEHLESAMDQLKPEDRDALVLRFFEDRSLRDVGHELGLGEDAARMRVNRALEKLRGIFGKLGIAGSAAWLVATLPASASAAVPVGLGASITAAVLSGTAIAATTAAVVSQTTSSTMNLLNLKLATAVVAAAAVTGTSTYLVKERQAQHLRAEYQSLNDTRAKLADEQKQAQAAVQLRDDQIEKLKKEVAELPRLRGEADRLNRQLAEMKDLQKQNEKLKDAIAKTRQQIQQNQSKTVEDELETQKEEEKQAAIRRMGDLRQLALALVIHADANQGWFPNTNEFAEMLRDGKVSLSRLRPENVALLYQGRAQDIPEPATTIVTRQIDYTLSPDSQKVLRSYGFADGHSEIHAASNLQELTAWENQHIIPPEQQSRRQ